LEWRPSSEMRPRQRVFSDAGNWTPVDSEAPYDGIINATGGSSERKIEPDYLQRVSTADRLPPNNRNFSVTLGEFYSRTSFHGSGYITDDEGDVRPLHGSAAGQAIAPLFSGYVSMFFFRWLQLLGLYKINDSLLARVYGYATLGLLLGSAATTTWASLHYYAKDGGLGSIISSFRTIASYGTMSASYVYGWWYLRRDDFKVELSSLRDSDIQAINRVIYTNFWFLCFALLALVLFLALAVTIGTAEYPLYDNAWATTAQVLGIIFGASGFVAVVNIFVIVCMISRIHILRFRKYALHTILTASRVLSSMLDDADEEAPSAGSTQHHEHKARTMSAVERRRAISSATTMMAVTLPGDVSVLLAVQNRLHMLVLMRYRRLCRRLRRLRGTWRVWISGALAVSLIFCIFVALALYQAALGHRAALPDTYTMGMWFVFSILMPLYLLFNVAKVNGEDQKIHRILTDYSLDLDESFSKYGCGDNLPHVAYADKVSFLQVFTPALRRGLREDMENIADGLSVLGLRVTMPHLTVVMWIMCLSMLPCAIELLFNQ